MLQAWDDQFPISCLPAFPTADEDECVVLTVPGSYVSDTVVQDGIDFKDGQSEVGPLVAEHCVSVSCFSPNSIL